MVFHSVPRTALEEALKRVGGKQTRFELVHASHPIIRMEGEDHVAVRRKDGRFGFHVSETQLPTDQFQGNRFLTVDRLGLRPQLRRSWNPLRAASVGLQLVGLRLGGVWPQATTEEGQRAPRRRG